jgi:hypothetical protein
MSIELMHVWSVFLPRAVAQKRLVAAANPAAHTEQRR